MDRPRHPQSKFSGNAEWTNIQFVRIGIQDTTGNPTELRLHSLDFTKRDPVGTNPNGVVVITADDSHVTQYAVLKDALAAHGRKATLMPIPGSHGTDPAIFLSDEQVIELHDTWRLARTATTCQATPRACQTSLRSSASQSLRR